MVEYTVVNYVLLIASAVVFVGLLVGCIILLAKERTRKVRKARAKKEEMRKLKLRMEACQRLQSPPPTEASREVSLRGINEWHILPPIKQDFRGYTVDSNSLGYRNNSMA